MTLHIQFKLRHGDPKVEVLESPYDQKWTIIETFNDNLTSNRFANAFAA